MTNLIIAVVLFLIGNTMCNRGVLIVREAGRGTPAAKPGHRAVNIGTALCLAGFCFIIAAIWSWL
jgi:hypothetical protein